MSLGKDKKGFNVINVKSEREDQQESNDPMNIKLKEQVALMKQRQKELLKELEDMDAESKIPDILKPQKKNNSQSSQANSRQLINGKSAEQSFSVPSQLPQGTSNESVPPVPQANTKPVKQENYVKKANDMNIKLFEMQQSLRQKEMERIEKDQDEKLNRFKKEKDVFTRQAEKIKVDYVNKNNKLKEQIARSKVAKDAYSLKQQELGQVKQDKIADIRKIETKQMQVNYDIEIGMSDIAKAEGVLNSLKLQVRGKDNENRALQESIRVETLETQKLITDLGEMKKVITKLEFDQAKVRDDRDRLIKEIERKNDGNNQRYTNLYSQFLKLESTKSEKQIQISGLQRQLDKKKEKVLDLKTDNKILEAKVEAIDSVQRKLQKRDKKVFEIEAYIEVSKKEKRVEIVEKVIEKPVVIDKPVIVEKPVLIREEIRINEPIQLEIVRVKSEMNNLTRANNEMINEVDYWRKKCLDQEDSKKIRDDKLNVNFDHEKIIMQEKISQNDQQIREINSKIAMLYTEIETLAKTNQSKNSQLSHVLSDIYSRNRSLETALIHTPPSAYVL